jgi:hypothetical protein
MNEAQPETLLIRIVILTISATITFVGNSEKNQNISFKPTVTEQTLGVVTDVYTERRHLKCVVQQVIFCDSMIELPSERFLELI